MTVSLVRRLGEFELSLIITESSRVESKLQLEETLYHFLGNPEMFRFLKVDFPEEILATLS